jgi:hypothetical protein
MVKISTVNKLTHGMQNNINCCCVCVCFFVKYKKQRKNSGKNPSFANMAKVKGGKCGRGRRTIDIGQWTSIDN